MLGRFEEAFAASVPYLRYMNHHTDHPYFKSINSYRSSKAFVYNAQADVALKGNNYDEAILLYTNAIELHEDVRYFWSRAVAHGQKRRWATALEDVEEVHASATKECYTFLT